MSTVIIHVIDGDHHVITAYPEVTVNTERDEQRGFGSADPIASHDTITIHGSNGTDMTASDTAEMAYAHMIAAQASQIAQYRHDATRARRNHDGLRARIRAAINTDATDHREAA